jgi:non-structural maintenance of chromosomes element 4
VKGPQEATLDSSILLMASNLGTQKARALKSGSGTFDIDDFVAKLLTLMGGSKLEPKRDPEDSDSEDLFYDEGEPLNWEKVGRRALAKSHRAPMMTYMCALFSYNYL